MSGNRRVSPAHRPGGHRAGDPRLADRLPGQGHRPRDGHRPRHQPVPEHQVRPLHRPRAAGRLLFGPALPWAAGKRVAPTGRAEAIKPDGKSITIATYSTRPELPEVAQVLQQDLAKAGFKVKPVVRGDSQVESDMLAGKYDAAVTSRDMMLDTGDPVSVLVSDFTCHGTYKLSQLCDKRVDRLVAAAQAQSDTGRRQDAAMKAEAAVLGTDAVIPLVHGKAVLGIAKSVQGALFSWDERQYIGTGTRR